VFGCQPAPERVSDPNDIELVDTKNDGKTNRVPVGTFELAIDPANGTATFVDYASTSKGLFEVNIERDGNAGTNPDDSGELVSANQGNGLADCGAVDTFCLDVTFQNFYMQALTDVEVHFESISPPTGHAATNSDTSAHGLDNTLGLFSFGNIDRAGGAMDSNTVTWNLGDDGVPFTVRGKVWANIDPCGGWGVELPDNDTMGLQKTLYIGEGGAITDVDISFDVTSTWVGDLIFTVEHDGTAVTVMDRPGVPTTGFGCSGDDIDMTLDDEAATPVEDECGGGVPTLDGSFTPNNPLAAFDGLDAAGEWRLTASDNATGDAHTVNEWCVLITR